jgi:hypothetical protein
VEGSEGSGESFVVARQAAEAGGPGEASLHHPPSRQQDEAALGFGMLDDFQLDAMLGGRFFSRLSRVPIVRSSNCVPGADAEHCRGSCGATACQRTRGTPRPATGRTQRSCDRRTPQSGGDPVRADAPPITPVFGGAKAADLGAVESGTCEDGFWRVFGRGLEGSTGGADAYTGGPVGMTLTGQFTD